MNQIELVSTREAAELTGVSVATINRWTASGKLTPAHKGEGIRGMNVFNRADVEELLAQETPASK